LRGFTFADEKGSPLVLLVQQQSLRIYAAYLPEKPPVCHTRKITFVTYEAFGLKIYRKSSSGSGFELRMLDNESCVQLDYAINLITLLKTRTE